VSQFPPETRYVDVAGGGQVGYQVVGDGPIDLVAAWGLGTNIDLAWDVGPAAALMRDLASISRYIQFDRRGTGVSDRISRDTPLTWEDWSEDVRAVLDVVGSSRAAVMAALHGSDGDAVCRHATGTGEQAGTGQHGGTRSSG
jgi:hypothetical protein